MLSNHLGLRNLVSFLLTLALAVWVGGSIVVDVLVVPGAFKGLPREHAIDLGAALFHQWNFLEAILGIGATLAASVLGRRRWGGASRQAAAVVILLAMTTLSLVFLLFLTPAIVARVTELRAAGVQFENLADMPPERKALQTIHTIYAALDVLKILAGMTVMWLFSGPRRP